jgi:predicted membrane protein
MKKIVIGVLFTMVGAFLLFNNMGFFIPEVYHVIISWPMLVIAIGTVLLFDKPSDHKSAGIVLILVGALFLIPKIFCVSIGGVIFPLLIIVVGLGFIVKAATRKNENKDYETWCGEHPNWKKHFNDFGKNITQNNESIVRKEYVFASSKEKWTQGKLKNVEIEAVFSGVELDFTQAELADGLKFAAYIKVKSVFSGVVLYVPDDWNIMVQKTGVFGGFTDNRPNRVLQVSSNKLVLLEVEAVFGGGEIRCYE